MLTPEKVLQESLKETQRVKLSELEDQRSAGETRKEEERSVVLLALCKAGAMANNGDV